MIDARRESILMFMYKKGYLKPMKRVPKAKSEGEEAFALHCKVEGINVVREYHFHPERRWRFDFVFCYDSGVPANLAVEIEGTMIGGSHHQRTEGYEKDLEKYNAAVKLGWRVLRYTKRMVLDGTAINDVLEILGRKPKGL